jgi:hypothetical protein
MDRNESLYFDEFSKKSLSEIREMFENLKHIGMAEDEIDKYAKQYREFFESRVRATTGYEHIDGTNVKPVNTSIPWRKDLMKGNTEITDLKKE